MLMSIVSRRTRVTFLQCILVTLHHYMLTVIDINKMGKLKVIRKCILRKDNIVDR